MRDDHFLKSVKVGAVVLALAYYIAYLADGSVPERKTYEVGAGQNAVENLKEVSEPVADCS